MLAALLILTIGTVTASAVHYAAAGPSGTPASATLRQAPSSSLVDGAPLADCPTVHLRAVVGAEA
jgi:hypothetical protein